MTDLGESTLDDWAANAALEDERFDFARFDVAARRAAGAAPPRHRARALANPLVVIANYVFDSVPADAFAVGDGDARGVPGRSSGDDVESMELAYSRAPVAARHYGDADLDALLEHYREQARDTVFTIPRAALECVAPARELAGDRLLVLVGRQGVQHRGGARATARSRSPARHGGAFSLMVNFHALGLYAAPPRRRGARTAATGTRRSTSARSLFGAPPGGHAETRLAYEEAIDALQPRRPVPARRGRRARRGASCRWPRSSRCCG